MEATAVRSHTSYLPGETDLTQMKRVTRKGYGNKTRKTDGKTNLTTTTNPPNTTPTQL